MSIIFLLICREKAKRVFNSVYVLRYAHLTTRCGGSQISSVRVRVFGCVLFALFLFLPFTFVTICVLWKRLNESRWRHDAPKKSHSQSVIASVSALKQKPVDTNRQKISRGLLFCAETCWNKRIHFARKWNGSLWKKLIKWTRGNRGPKFGQGTYLYKPDTVTKKDVL